MLSLMGELARAGKLDTSAGRLDYRDLAAAIGQNDILSPDLTEKARKNWLSSPGFIGHNLHFASQENYFDTPDTNRESGCTRSIENAYSQDGGLAVLYGNLATDGAVVKTAGVTDEQKKFTGPARVFYSQEEAVEGILGGRVQPGDVVAILFEGPKGGPGMQEMLYPTSYLKSMGLDKTCALITDGRFSGGTAGLSIGHICPEAAAGGAIGLLQDGDMVEIDIQTRQLNVVETHNNASPTNLAKGRVETHNNASPTDLAKGRVETHNNASLQASRQKRRVVSKALQAYASMVGPASEGAVRII
jgi:dihydroxy-acid dehydratase